MHPPFLGETSHQPVTRVSTDTLAEMKNSSKTSLHAPEIVQASPDGGCASSDLIQVHTIGGSDVFFFLLGASGLIINCDRS